MKTKLKTLAALAVLALSGMAQAQSASASAADTDALVAKGRYLAVAGDCAACHTATTPGAQPFAGGYSIESPLGTIYATNITPSKTAGIGSYTEEQFARALRQGVRADGQHLYPAMPYTAYTVVSDEDTHALYTYFMKGVAPVDTAPQQTALPFPFNIRASMAVWNTLFLQDRRFVPDAALSQEVNRGAYLANGPAHCSTCHTARNVLMAEDHAAFLGGGPLGAWYAPNITPDARAGIGSWSDAELLQYLRTGHTEHAQAAGPMAEAVEKSFQHMEPADLKAIVAYLRTVPPVAEARQAQPATAFGKPRDDEATQRGAVGPNERKGLHAGAALFSGYCASCHQANGAGSQNGLYPALFHNTATGHAQPANLVAAILYGVDREVDGHHVLMPRFDQQSQVQPLTDEQIASVSNYVLARYGNLAVEVQPRDVAEARAGGPRPLLARLQPMILPLMVAGVVVVLLLIAFLVMRWRVK
ncbi:c-type cytochrome [Xylophilus rhododendri]|uniref:C-type cytochrome n=1 Tax=Xylophilus rhododendri TaxID=2697032 RepID=A0A857J1X5_9BURK|nr:cytochrome c [Xylophilus rhododendri]QHI97716.1 c-type cytochrome [Xylophilus rhododendri]